MNSIHTDGASSDDAMNTLLSHNRIERATEEQVDAVKDTSGDRYDVVIVGITDNKSAVISTTRSN